MFLVAARTLAELVTEEDFALGRIYPSLTRIREVSIKIAVKVARESIRAGLAVITPDDDQIECVVNQSVYQPIYQNYV